MITNPSISAQNFRAHEKNQFSAHLSLNDALKESLKKAQTAAGHVQMIVRCENLPRVNACYDEMVHLFDTLLEMILNHPGAAQLYLYVDCEEEDNDVMHCNLTDHEKRYHIKLHTNITTHEHWNLVNGRALINCRRILSKHNGILAVNEISSAGCLFCVTLPGKIE